MLSYRHSFHAGNAADVLKHIILIYCLDYLKTKEKPILCADTHAGPGLYVPGEEYKDGFGRLKDFILMDFTLKDYSRNGFPPDKNIPAPVSRYLELVSEADNSGEVYPGSPLIFAKVLRGQDRLVCFELHPQDYAGLKSHLDAYKQRLREKQIKAPVIEGRQEDGLLGLKGLLPPPSRRGLVLIDPAWEEIEEFSLVPKALKSAMGRFPEGTYILWYPLFSPSVKDQKTAAAAALPETLPAPGGEKRLRVELYTSPKGKPPENSRRGMYGSGLVIYNPPWTLKAALEETLPFLAMALGSPGEFKLAMENE
jgi:23S rRNA (adenine2030-N6)-methyltransferase